MTPKDREIEQRYEELRREILEDGRGRGPGLAIFLRQGMACWLRELVKWTGDALSRHRQVGPPTAPIPSSTKDEFVHVLTGMILGRECGQGV